jgi:RNA-splicing ligase RtcB
VKFAEKIISLNPLISNAPTMMINLTRKKVRETIKELGGTMPENLPTPKESVTKIEKSQKNLEDKNYE